MTYSTYFVFYLTSYDFPLMSKHLACSLYVYVCMYVYIHNYTGLFEMIVGVLTTCHTQYT